MAAPAGLTRLLSSRRAWLDGPSRLAGLDLARGLAVIGMLASHLIEIPPWDWGNPATWGDIVNGRSSILFALVAGVSIALVTGGRTPLSGDAMALARLRLAVRAGLLWTIGILLVVTGIPVAVILPAYGILFLLSLPFLRLRATTLFAIAAGIAVVMPWFQAVMSSDPFWDGAAGAFTARIVGWAYPFPTWIAFVLAGVGIGRLDLRSIRTGWILVAVGAPLAIAGYALDAVSGADYIARFSTVTGAFWTAHAHSTGILEVVGSGGFAVAAVGLCLLVCRTPIRWIVLPLRATGAMPLTAYTGQLLAWAVAAQLVLGSTRSLSDFRALDPFLPMTIGVVLFCTLWALFFGRGPLERAIDSVTRRI